MIALALSLAAADCGSLTTQTAMNQCSYAAYQQADAALNAQWTRTKAAVAQRSPAESALLLAAQRAWLAYRDAECRVEGAGYAGGTMQPLILNTCLADLTTARTAQLAAIATGPEG